MPPDSLQRLTTPWMLAIAFAALIGWQSSDVRRLSRQRTEQGRALAGDSARLVEARRDAERVSDSLAAFLNGRAARDSATDLPYLVVSIADNRLWYRRGNAVLFETRVATGSGKFLEQAGSSGEQWKFETPRGRLVVQRKDVEPAWVPPDWHYVEAAQRRQLELVRLVRGLTIPLPDGSVIALSGGNVVQRYPNGREVPFEVKEGQEIQVENKLIMPPLGAIQRRYVDVLGANRLYLGDGYGIHGTDVPSSIGRSVSHGCIRVRNEDIETLFRIVPLGTPVYVY